jgi:hypothetical protein
MAENGSVYPLPAQSFSGPNPAGLIIIFYYLRFETPPTCRTRSLYFYFPGTGWPNYSPQSLGSLFVASYDSQGNSGVVQPHLHTGRILRVGVEVRVILRLAVYRQSVRFREKPLETSYATSSLTRGRVCRLQLLMTLASTLTLRHESRGTHEHILLSRIPDSSKLEGQVHIFISPRYRQ